MGTDRLLRPFGEPIQLLYLGALLHRRWSHFSPLGMIPSDRLQSIVSWLESHWGLNWPAIRGIKGDCYLAAVILPMAKQSYGAVASIFCNRGATIRTQA